MRVPFLLLVLLFFSTPAVADPVPLNAFARLPALRQPVLSPDGSKIAVLLANQDHYYDVAVTDFGSSDFVIVAKMKSPRDRLLSVRWGSNDRLLVSAAFLEEAGAVTYYVTKLYSVDVNSGDMLELKPNHYETSWGNRYSNNGDVISVLRNDPEHILVEWETSKDAYPGVFKVNIYNGRYEKLFLNEYGVDSWYAGYDGTVRLGLDWSEKEEEDDVLTFWVGNSSEGAWKKVKTVKQTEDATFSPLMVNETGELLYVLSTHETDTAALYSYDLNKGEFAERLWHVDGYDVDGLLTQDGKLVGVRWTEHFEKQHYFTEGDDNLYKLVKNTFRGAEVSLASTDRMRERAVVYAVRDDMAGRYFLLDVKAGKAYPWFGEYPELSGVTLAKQMPFEYEARDGLKIQGYLTLPVNVEGKPPLIVLPHGGPWARDYQYFDYFAQFFANRGYAVVQMNFRGSSGFGASFERAGDKQRGMKMQDDVIDAYEWVVQQGYVDPDRACIVGASYGGYVALAAAVQTPGMFDCIVSIAGVSDMIRQIEDQSRIFGGEAYYDKYVGDLDDAKDREMLARYSPINGVDRLKDPVLLFHGSRDSQVSDVQSEIFYQAAKRAGADIEYVKVADATHFLDDAKTRLKAFEVMEDFLAKHLQQQ